MARHKYEWAPTVEAAEELEAVVMLTRTSMLLDYSAFYTIADPEDTEERQRITRFIAEQTETPLIRWSPYDEEIRYAMQSFGAELRGNPPISSS